ncbi:MAG: hypothetical protein OEW62_10490 [Candidatus Bathyarchaeota archaeon]|nr:hypothetical protein [Candidatus Bathyarchaeota archaeon]
MKSAKSMIILTVLATLLYLSSIFLPWLYERWFSAIPEETYGEAFYWSYRRVIRVNGLWSSYQEVSFFDFWNMSFSHHVDWISVLFFQLLTIAFGFVGVSLEVISKGGTKVKIAVVALALFSSVFSLLYCIVQMGDYTRYSNIVDFHLGFWTAVSACIMFLVTIVAEIFTFIGKRGMHACSFLRKRSS